MKRILLAIVLLIGIGGAGFQYMQFASEKKVVQQLNVQLTDTKDQIQQYTAMLQEMPLAKYSTNTQLVSDVLNTDILTLMQITAQSKDEKGQYNNVVSVQTIEETAYFTNTISRLVVDASFNDFKKAYTYLSELTVPYSAINFDMKNKIVSIYLTPATIGTSDISSEYTTTNSESLESNSESDEGAPAAAGNGANGDELSNSNDSVEEAVDAGVAATEFDIQYLGGDK